MAKRRGRKKKIKVETLLKLKRRAEFEGAKYGKLLDSPEDAGQEYVTRLLEGKHRKSTVQQALIDMAREQGGRPGQPGHEAKKNLAFATSVDPATIRAAYDPTGDQDNALFLQAALEYVKHPKQRLVLELYLEGLTYQQIADSEEFGCTQAYIHHLFQKAIKTIRKRLAVSK